jgi:hypothetical protein
MSILKVRVFLFAKHTSSARWRSSGRSIFYIFGNFRLAPVFLGNSAQCRCCFNFVETTPASCGIIRLASPEEQYPPWMQHPREANDPTREVVVTAKCYLLSLLKIHRPDCADCKALEKCGLEMRERLEELNWRAQHYSLYREPDGEVVEVFNSMPGEVVVNPPVLSALQLAQQVDKAA